MPPWQTRPGSPRSHQCLVTLYRANSSRHGNCVGPGIHLSSSSVFILEARSGAGYWPTAARPDADAALMRRVLNGGETALGTLYDRYSVFGCKPHSRDTEAAE